MKTPEKYDSIKRIIGGITEFRADIIEVYNGRIKFKYANWDTFNVWVNIDCIEWNEEDDCWIFTKVPSYDRAFS